VRNLKHLFALLASLLLACATVGLSETPTLSEAAQREAERRKNLDQNGVEAKIIEEKELSQSALSGNVSTSSPHFSSKPASKETVPKLQPYRKALQKYDREIRQIGEKLKTLRGRSDSEKWALPKIGKISQNGDSSSSQEKLRSQIRDLELKLGELQRERLETYDAGRKAGFLPGELDGKGMIP
jgi:hypothetical protein